MVKLTDAQLVILSAAASREDRAALPLPKSLKLKGAALSRTLDGLRKKGLLEEQPAPREAVAWREEQDGRRLMLAITEAGLAALDAGPAKGPAKPAAPPKTQAKKPRTERKPAGPKPQADAPAQARQGTKLALLVDLLERKSGATIGEIAEASGWQAHSVRGAISGALKKKLGLAIASEKVEGRGRVYRIAGDR